MFSRLTGSRVTLDNNRYNRNFRKYNPATAKQAQVRFCTSVIELNTAEEEFASAKKKLEDTRQNLPGYLLHNDKNIITQTRDSESISGPSKAVRSEAVSNGVGLFGLLGFGGKSRRHATKRHKKYHKKSRKSRKTSHRKKK